MATKNVSMKLVIDSEGDRVLFAEAGKDVVDFLFHILSLPVGTVTRLLTKQGMVGSVGNLYQSIENINETYILPKQDKNTLLKPSLPVHVTDVPRLLPNTINPSSRTPKKFYRCSSPPTYQNEDFFDLEFIDECVYISVDPNRRCPSHEFYKLNMELELVDPPENSVSSSSSEERGFVKGAGTYMIMDDLVVSPMSTISSITLLSKLNIKDVTILQEKVVDLGTDQALELLKASLQSKTVLTDVFLPKEYKKMEF